MTLKELENDAEEIWLSIKTAIATDAQAIWELLKPFLQEAVTNMEPVTMAAVADVATTVAGNIGTAGASAADLSALQQAVVMLKTKGVEVGKQVSVEFVASAVALATHAAVVNTPPVPVAAAGTSVESGT